MSGPNRNRLRSPAELRVTRRVAARTAHFEYYVLPRVMGIIYGVLIFFRAVPFQFWLSKFIPQLTAAQNATAMQGQKNIYDYFVLLVGALCFFDILIISRSRLIYWKSNVGLFCFLFFLCISSLWSNSTYDSFRMALWPISTCILGIGFSLRFSLNVQVRILAFVILIAMLLSIAFVYIFPAYAVHQHSDAFENVHAGKWRGIYEHKNQLGAMAGAGVVTYLLANRASIGPLYFRMIGLSVCLLVLIMAGSANGFVSTIATISIVLIITKTAGPVRSVGLPLLVLALGGLLATGLDPLEIVANLTHRTATLSGRTDIWALSISSFRERWLFGYGWQSAYGSLRAELLARFNVNHPHNTILDLLLSLGMLGTMLFGVWLAQAGFAARRFMLNNPEQIGGGYALVALIIFWFANGFSESLLAQTSPFSVIGVCVLAGVASWHPSLGGGGQAAKLNRHRSRARPGGALGVL